MEKSYLKSLVEEVSAIEVKSEAQQIAKYELIEYVEELQDRINKAIEYIKYNATSNYFDEEKNMFRREKDLLEILKGGIK